MKIAMRNINRYGFDWENFHPINDRLVVRAMDEKDFDPEYKFGTVQDNYDDALAFEVVQVGASAAAEGLQVGHIVAIISPALDFTGKERYYSCTLADVVGWTTRDEQKPMTLEERGIK